MPNAGSAAKGPRPPDPESGRRLKAVRFRMRPLFEPIEFGVADRMMIRAIADGLGIQASEVNRVYKKEGDIIKVITFYPAEKGRYY